MENRSFYNEILTEHNLHPEFKHDLPDADIVLEGVNPSCGDDIFLKLKLDAMPSRTARSSATAAPFLRPRQISCWVRSSEKRRKTR